jgi:hypothetical protein
LKKIQSQRVTHNVDRTPKATRDFATTTPKRKREDSGIAEVEVMSPDPLLSPEGPAFIGPTPQRNGIAIGLFDLLPAETPSRRGALADLELNIMQTPSRKDSETSLESRARGEKTPQSTSKRFLLDSFLAVTPNKRKLADATTPSSRGLATPAFLRRYNPLVKINEDEEATPRPAPWARRSFGRSLSARIQAMRQEEDDRFDEEADIMRELEMEADGMPAPKRIKVPEIQVEDSQAAMPLGPDRGLESETEDEAENGLGPDGQPRKIWKKRGLKRQTRRVISTSFACFVFFLLTIIQCDPTSSNQNLNLKCSLMSPTRRPRVRKLRPALSTPSTSRTFLTSTMTTSQTTQATRLTARKSAGRSNPNPRPRQRQRETTTKRARRERLKQLHVRSSRGHTQITRGSRSRARGEMAVKDGLDGSDRRMKPWYALHARPAGRVV